MNQSSSHHQGYEQVAHLYDLFDDKANIEFFLHYASQAREILDIGAGTGRIAIPLAERGIKVCCIEPSPAMRREFKSKLAQHPKLQANIRLIAGDAQSFDAERTFPAAFLSGCFDHFLNDEERTASLLNIGRHLISGGVLVFDVFLGLMEDSLLSPAGTAKIGAKLYRRFVGGRALPGNVKETLLVFETYQDGELIERTEERSLVGLTNRGQIHRLLHKAGFDVRREWGNYAFTKFKEGDDLLIVEATRQNRNPISEE